jgi:hypothetical protein
MTPFEHLWEVKPGAGGMTARVHYCINQIKIAEGTQQPPAKSCRCRKFISTAEADAMVRKGDASWTIISRRELEVEIPCSMCAGDPEVKNCANCQGTGREFAWKRLNSYGNDIVLTSQAPVDNKKGASPTPQSSALAKKTPRVATIEKAHIERAYIYNYKEDQERIEDYGRLTLEARKELVVPFFPDLSEGRLLFCLTSDSNIKPGVYAVGTDNLIQPTCGYESIRVTRRPEGTQAGIPDKLQDLRRKCRPVRYIEISHTRTQQKERIRERSLGERLRYGFTALNESHASGSEEINNDIF